MREYDLARIKVLACDVDGTLVQGKVSPDMAHVIRHVIERVPFALISGSSYQALEKKLLNDIGNVQNSYEVYASGGSVRLTYGRSQPIYDPSYGSDVNIPKADRLEVAGLVESHAKRQDSWGRNWLEAEDFLYKYREWAREKGEGGVPEILGEWKVSRTLPGMIDPKSALRVEERQDPLGTRVVGLSIKSVPRVLQGIGAWFVESLARKLRERLIDQYQVMPAGFASVDVNMDRGSKARAITHICEAKGVDPSQILYLGDEFGEHGNDKAVSGAGVVCVDVSKPQNGLTGPDLAINILRKLF